VSDNKVSENRFRRVAQRQGLTLHKSHAATAGYHYGTYGPCMQTPRLDAAMGSTSMKSSDTCWETTVMSEPKLWFLQCANAVRQ
jgi:hypothetical protein